MRNRLFIFSVVVLTGCGAFGPEYVPPAPTGKTCYVDADCAPNACCGQGTAVVHTTEAPDCALTTCTNMCPKGGIKCGCAVPVCRGNQCTSAVSSAANCG